MNPMGTDRSVQIVRFAREEGYDDNDQCDQRT
jgi:hypothetical protein